MKRKILSILLVLAMTLTLLPTAVLADEAGGGNAAELTYKIDSDTVVIEYAALSEAVNAANEAAGTDRTIKLLDDVTYSTATCFDIEKELTLDLNGHAVDACANGGHPSATHFIRIENGGNLTITDTSENKDGSITARYAGNSVLLVMEVMDGGTLTVEGGKIQNAGGTATNYGSETVYVRSGGIFYLNGGNIHSARISASKRIHPVYNNGGTVVMNGGSVTSTSTDEAFSISSGTLTINGGDITGLTAASAIWSTSKPTVTINGGSFKGALKADWLGEDAVGVYDGTNTVIAESAPSEYVANLNGRIYYTGEGGADKAFTAAANGDMLTLRAALASDTKAKTLSLNNTLTITLENGASFDASKLLPAAGCLIETTAISEMTTKYTAVVDQEQAQAKIGDKYYVTLGSANVAAQDGDTITVLHDINNSGSAYAFTKSVTLDLNGHEIKSAKRNAKAKNEYATVIKFSGAEKTLTIIDSSESGTGAVTNTAASDYGYALIVKAGTVKLEAGTYKGTSANSTLYVMRGTLSISGGTFSCDPTAYLTDCAGTQVQDDMYVVTANHTPAKAVRESEVEASCTEAGSYDEVVYCSVCETEISRDHKTIFPLGHTFAEEYTSDETGHWHKCIRCDATDEKAPHKFDTEDCSEKATCEVCSYEKTAGKHTWDDGVVTAEPTCTAAGQKTYTCTSCHATKTEEIPATGHSYSEAWTTSEAKHWHACANCDSKRDEADHTWNDGVVTTEPTTSAEGVKTYTCTVCGATKTETIDKLPSGNGGSSGGGSSSSGSATKTETTTNPDGSTTKTETRADGTTIKTTTTTDGSTGTVTTDKSGTKSEIEVKISDKAAEEAEKKDASVTAPIEVAAGKSSNSAPTIKIELPKNADETKVEIPVSNVTSGTVAVIVHEDGTEEIVKTSVVTENGVALDIKGSATVKIVDNSKEFLDTKDHWSREEVNFVASRELFNGIGNNLFGVSGDMTRGMVTTVLARLAGEETDGGANWYDKGTEWAVKNGVSDGTNPTGNITREQIAAMLYRFAGSPAVSGELSFTDADQVSDYAKDALLWAVQNGILNGIGNNLAAPQSSAERAQVAAMMARYIKNVG